ncbi:MAG: tRNA-dihydrouridine synthase family protein [Bacteroidales bacterium]|nr:tRNA-dihydrouridine synthase family protein [Bacteroidales bacterium]
MEIYFAPLQGFTDFVFRNSHAKYFKGVNKYFTPFLRVENGEIRKKDIKDLSLSTVPNLVPQIMANSCVDVEILVQCVKNHGFKECDLNFGCPFPQQSKHFYGAGIWDKPEKVSEVLSALKNFPEISFSLKMRLGNTDVFQTLDLIEVINSADLKFVTIHPRLGKQMYSGEIDFKTFETLYEKLSFPIVYNGDLKTPADIETLIKKYPKLKGVMIGRGLLSNPFLAEGSPFDKKRFMEFHNSLIDGYSEIYGGAEFMVLDKMKTFWTYSDKDKKVLKKIQKSKSLSEYIASVAMAVQN